MIDAYVEQLDMEKLGFQRTTAPVMGRPPYSPKDLLKLYLYGYLNRVRSSRRLEHEAIRNIEVIWLLKKLKPDFKTIADFRKDNKKALKAVFRDFIKLCGEWDLFGKELVAMIVLIPRINPKEQLQCKKIRLPYLNNKMNFLVRWDYSLRRMFKSWCILSTL